MAYRLKPGRFKPEAIRTIAREQVARAVAALSHDPVPPEGVHEARKVVKRLRSLLRLIEPSLRAGDFKARNKEIGRLGDRLAGAREAHVMRETVAKLEGHFDGEAKAVLAPLAAMFADDVEGHAPELSGERARRIIDGFVEEGRRLDRLAIKGRGFDCVAGGLKRTYRAARKAFARAYDKPGDKRFHDLRKAVQWHQRHVILLSRAWPEQASMRVSACRDLAERLGDDHDLSVLIEIVERRGGATLDQAGVIRLARRRQAELRAAAFALAQRLFAETPPAFMKRMARYWGSAPLIPAALPRPPAQVKAGAGSGTAPDNPGRPPKEDHSQTPS
ncbi:MAG TPA: CHAD domain-containing protein [Hyphomicrobium sp.]|nr:CHAD domain-containing protein [Hyphomicrobium sp.]